MVRGELLIVVTFLFLTVTWASSKSEGGGSPKKTISRPSARPLAPNHKVLNCDDVQFYLATREDPAGTTKACVNQNTIIFNGKLDVLKPTKILFHGWKNNRTTYFEQNLTREYLKAGDVNVIQVDWGKEAEMDYSTSVYMAAQVGYTVAQFVLEMVRELKLDVNNVYLVGFSLGAQVAGIAGYYTSPKVARVIGLDPAGPLFNTKGPSGTITPESGQFVITAGSCKYRLGTYLNLGHLNFYVNNGMCQAGCWEENAGDTIGFCSHNRAPAVFISSLAHPEGFLATKCDSYLEYEVGMCDYQPTTYFTENVDASVRGIYYFRTSSTNPFTIKNETKVRRRPRFRLSSKSLTELFTPKDEETSGRLKHFSSCLHQTLSMRDHADSIKALLRGTHVAH